MAARNRTRTHRHDEAQPADQHSDDDPARKTRARMRRVKEAARHREHATLAIDDERAGPGIGDRQGEVA
jgi:C4-type Zn-finger protein